MGGSGRQGLNPGVLGGPGSLHVPGGPLYPVCPSSPPGSCRLRGGGFRHPDGAVTASSCALVLLALVKLRS